MTDDYQYVQTPLTPNPAEFLGFGGASNSGLGLTVGNSPDASGRPGRSVNGGSGGGTGIGGFNPPLPPTDQYVVFPNPPAPSPSGSGDGIGEI